MLRTIPSSKKLTVNKLLWLIDGRKETDKLENIILCLKIRAKKESKVGEDNRKWVGRLTL